MLLQQMLDAGRLPEFIDGIWKADNDDKMWDFYLHKVQENISFEDFKAKVVQPEPAVATKNDIEATVKYSFDLMQNFKPK